MNKLYAALCLIALLCGFFAPHFKTRITLPKTTLGFMLADNNAEEESEDESSSDEEDEESEFA